MLVHDFWAPYWNFDVTHAVCGAHLLRELTAAADTKGQDGWAGGMDRLLCEINRTVTGETVTCGFTAMPHCAEALAAPFGAVPEENRRIAEHLSTA